MENIISSVVIRHIEEEPVSPGNCNRINGEVVPQKDVQVKDVLVNDVKNRISHGYVSDNSSEYESAGSTKSSSTQSVNEIVSQEMMDKAVTPNILGNALKAMKNLFSPDKLRNKTLNASAQKEEEPVPNDKKMDLLDVSALTARLSSISLDSLSNVNDDSFITTDSRVDDSFQSAYTHLGDQNISDPLSINEEEEDEKSNKTFVEIPIDVNLDLSCNETSPAHDNLEDTVLMKKDSLDDSAELKEAPAVPKLGLESYDSPIVLEQPRLSLENDNSPIVLEGKNVKCSTPIGGQSEEENSGRVTGQNEGTIDLEKEEEKNRAFNSAMFDVEKISEAEGNKINDETFELKKDYDVNMEEIRKEALDYLNSVEEALRKDLAVKENSEFPETKILNKTVDLSPKENLVLVNSPQEDTKMMEKSDVNRTFDLGIKVDLDSGPEPEGKFLASPNEVIESPELINKTYELEGENHFPIELSPIQEEKSSISLEVISSDKPESLNKTFDLEVKEIPSLPDPKENSSPEGNFSEIKSDGSNANFSPVLVNLQNEENSVLPESKIVENLGLTNNSLDLGTKENIILPETEVKNLSEDLDSKENSSAETNLKPEEGHGAAPEIEKDDVLTEEKVPVVPGLKENVPEVPEISGKSSEKIPDVPESKENPTASVEISGKISDTRKNFPEVSNVNGKPEKISDMPDSKENLAALEINGKSSVKIVPEQFLEDTEIEGKPVGKIPHVPELKEHNENNSGKISIASESKEKLTEVSEIDQRSSEEILEIPESSEQFLEINGKSSGEIFNSPERKGNSPTVQNQKSLEEISDAPDNFFATAEISDISENFLAGKFLEKISNTPEFRKNFPEVLGVNGESSEKISDAPELKENSSAALEISGREKISESRKNFPEVPDVSGKPENPSDVSESKENFLAALEINEKSSVKISDAPESRKIPEINGKCPEENLDLSENFSDALEFIEKPSAENFSSNLLINDKTLDFEIKEIAEKIHGENQNLKVDEVIENNFSSDEIKISRLNVELCNGEKSPENLNSTVIEVKGKISPKPNSNDSNVYSPTSVALLDSSIHSELEKFQKGDSSFSAPEINKNEQINQPETNAGEGLIKTNGDKFDFLNRNNTEEDLISGMKGLKLDDSFRSAEDFLEDKLSSASDKSESDITQFIQEQFTANDIEKICSVVEELPVVHVNRHIMRASQIFDKSFQEKFSEENGFTNTLSPEGLDFLDSIQGKSCGRDFSRESLYVKFDPLVESKPKTEILLQISPPKAQPVNVVAPLTPVTRNKDTPDDPNKVKHLQQEIERLTRALAEKEKANQDTFNDYENQLAKLTGQTCLLEDKLGDSQEREKSLVRKLRDQQENISQLRLIMEEYTKVIAKLTKELSDAVNKNKEETEGLKAERDSYMTHLQNTEAAFSDVHLKYEKSKKTIEYHREKEIIYKNTIAEQSQLIEDHKEKANEIKEKAVRELNKMHNEIDEMKMNHAQEASRVRAQLRKTELKVQALQESLDQKIKENKALTIICDDLIAGKK